MTKVCDSSVLGAEKMVGEGSFSSQPSFNLPIVGKFVSALGTGWLQLHGLLGLPTNDGKFTVNV